MKAGFNPDQPRDDHGRWTDTGTTDTTFEALLDGFDVPENVAYPDDFHDTVRDYFVEGLLAGGNKVETEVSLVLPGSPTFVGAGCMSSTGESTICQCISI